MPGPSNPIRAIAGKQRPSADLITAAFIGEIINYPGKSPLKLKRLQKGPFCGGDHPARKWPLPVKSTQRQNWFHLNQAWQQMHRSQCISAVLYSVCDDTRNLKETESETFFQTKYFRYRIRYFFRYQIFLIPNPILFSIPNISDTESDTFFDTKYFTIPNPILFQYQSEKMLSAERKLCSEKKLSCEKKFLL